MIALEAVLLGLVIGAVLGGLGGGGAILTVPALVYLLDQPAQAATTGSLVIVGLSALTGVLPQARSGHVHWRLGLTFGLVGLPATWLGSRLNHHVDEDVLLLGFSLLMLAAATAMLTDRAGRPRREQRSAPSTAAQDRAQDRAQDPAPGADRRPQATATLARPDAPGRRTRSHLSPVGVVATALLVGLLTGFFGVGGGFVVVPALVVVLGMRMQQAVGTSLLVVALNSGTALLSRLGGPEVDWSVVLPFALAAMLAAVLGKQLADRLPARRLTVGFAVLLILVAGYTAWQSVPGITA